MNSKAVKNNRTLDENSFEYLSKYFEKIVPVLIRIETDLSAIINQNFVRSENGSDLKRNEYSSNEILKTIDLISKKINNIFCEFTEIFDVNVKEKIKLAEFLEELCDTTKNKELSKYSGYFEEQLVRIRKMISNDYENINKFTELQNIFEEISDGFTSIYMSLEIQNITSHQLNMIYHILSEIKSNIEKTLFAINNNDSDFFLNSIKPSLIELNQRIAGIKY